MRVIGTAGHVDHGKSTLVAALTGVHPDRLKEEQARQMTIELGFGWLALPDGEQVGIVDVPGHRDFIENMLSGIGGIDAALLVIAADEGVMPQTREHLAILDLLQIPAGLIVLTKTDLAPDPGWLDLVEADVRATVAGTALGEAPIIRVSARTRSGLEALLAALQSLLSTRPARPDLGRPRLPVDRVFTMSGFGTVVTGTLVDGHLTLGEEVEVLPGGLRGRIRGLQTHRMKEETAVPGSRTAVNISGIEAESIRRGDVVAHPGHYQPTRRLDARFRLLPDASTPVKHGDEVKFFSGASEAVAMLRLLGREELLPGQEGWVQLELRQPVVAVRGDRYILRRPSPGETLGGGAVVDHQPRGRHRRFDEQVLRSLESLARGTPAEVLLEAALALEAAPLREIVSRSRLEPAQAGPALDQLLLDKSLVTLEEGLPAPDSDLLAMALPHWTSLRDRALAAVEFYHQSYPLRRGIPRQELKSRLKVSPRLFNVLVGRLAARGLLEERASFLARPGHRVAFDPGQQAAVQELLQAFERNPYSPPGLRESQAQAGAEVLNALVDMGELVLVSGDILLRKQDYDKAVQAIRGVLLEKERITLAEVRDLLNTSRKYAQALLEHLDAAGLTTRDGDFRRLKKR